MGLSTLRRYKSTVHLRSPGVTRAEACHQIFDPIRPIGVLEQNDDNRWATPFPLSVWMLRNSLIVEMEEVAERLGIDKT